MTAATLEKALASTASVLANVTADQLDDPTPCASWKVRDLINHVVGAAAFFAVMAETGQPAGGDGVQPDFAGGDFNASFRDGARRAVAAFGADGVMDRTMVLPFGEVPGAVFVKIAATDTFTHAWDLARATNQATSLDPALAAELLEGAKMTLPDAMRGPDGIALFGPRVEVPDSAPAADQLAAFLGRTP